MQLNDTVIFNNVINLLLTRKIKYDQERSGLMKWVEWDNEKFANKIDKNLETIPKILHFIWLGTAPIPQYAEENMDAWKKLHPNFDIKL